MAKKPQFTDQLKHLIETSGKTRYAISQETGIDQATLSRFMAGKGGLSMPNLDKVCEALDLELKARAARRKGR